MENAEAPKRKHKSGAQKRKERAARDALAKDSSLSVARAWTSRTDLSTAIDPNGPPIELPIYGQPPVTLVRAVSSAIVQLEQGNFYASAYLWDGMLRDDRVAATLQVRIDRLIGSPLELQPAISDDDDDAEDESEPDEDDELAALDVDIAKKAVKDCERQISRIMPTHQLSELMRWGLGLSVGIAQVTSTRTTKTRSPTFEVWNPRYVRYDWTDRCYHLVTQNRGELTLERDDPEWIIWEPFGPYGWLHGAMLRAAVQPWLIRYWTRVWWSRHQEVHGQPLRLGIIPSQREPKDERQFLSELSNLAHESVIRLPRTGQDDKEGFDVKLLEAAANTWQGFRELIQHCDDSIAILFLGQRQSTNGQGGLGSQENAGESTMVRVTRRDALVGEMLRDQLLKPWAKDNYGNAEYAPFLKWQIEPPEDESKVATVDLAIAQALAAFKASGAPLNVRAYLEDRGYPLLTEEEHSAEKQAAVADAQEMMQAKTPDLPPGDDANPASETDEGKG